MRIGAASAKRKIESCPTATAIATSVSQKSARIRKIIDLDESDLEENSSVTKPKKTSQAGMDRTRRVLRSPEKDEDVSRFEDIDQTRETTNSSRKPRRRTTKSLPVKIMGDESDDTAVALKPSATLHSRASTARIAMSSDDEYVP
ncbi:hypothetical protein SpCBS45565_g05062 [Spizellomyces sp. 'palustris']|nr:hypothetical protein SpCBS45565_g05062 [Spizellomyces sp. 'palustris']